MITIRNEIPRIAKPGEPVALDIEMFGQEDNRLHRPTGIFACMSIQFEGEEDVYQIYDTGQLPETFDHLKDGLWVLHNAVYDFRQLRRWENKYLFPTETRPVYDTMLVEKVLWGGYYDSFRLNDLARRYLDMYMEKETREQFETASEMTEEMKQYAALDVTVTLAVRRAQLALDRDLTVYWDIDMPMIWVVLDMLPVKVDVDLWDKEAVKFEELAKEVEGSLGVNVMSPNQVKEFLKSHRIDVPSTGQEILEEYEGNEYVDRILEARMYRTAVSKYGRKWIEKFVEDGNLVYADWKVTGAETGRMCISGDTLLNTNKGTIRIDDEKLFFNGGISIISHRGVYRRILRRFYKGISPMYRVTLENGNSITCTKRHKFLTPLGWRSLDELQCGSKMCTYDYHATIPSGGQSESSIGRGKFQRIISESEINSTPNQRKIQNSSSCVIGNYSILSREICCGDASSSEREEYKKVPWQYEGEGEKVGFRSYKGRDRGNDTKGRDGMGDVQEIGNIVPCDASNIAYQGYQSTPSKTSEIEARRLGNHGGIGKTDSRFSGVRPTVWGQCIRVLQETLLDIPQVTQTDLVCSEVCTSMRLSPEYWKSSEELYLLESQSSRDGIIFSSLFSGRGTCAPISNWKTNGRFLHSGEKFNSGSKWERSSIGVSDFQGRDEIGKNNKFGVQIIEPECGRSAKESHEICFGYSTASIVSIEYVGNLGVWDIEVETDHSYQAHGFINHNSASNPPLQGIPARKLPIYRTFFIPNNDIIYAPDVAQQEPRITAYLSQDQSLLTAVRNNDSVHVYVARMIFNDPTIEKGEDPRYKIGKAISLGLSYGLTAKGTAKKVNVSLEEAEHLLHTYFQRFPEVENYMLRMRTLAMRRGYVTTVAGRRIWLNMYNYQWENNAVNAPIQGSAADFTKRWGTEIWRACKRENIPFPICMFVHDEIVMDVKKEYLEDIKRINAEAVAKASEMFPGVPFVFDENLGENWACHR